MVQDECSSFLYIIFICLVSLIGLGIFLYLVFGFFACTAKHDTISSSIFYEPTNVDNEHVNNPNTPLRNHQPNLCEYLIKRAFNIFLGLLSFSMICMYVDEYQSRGNQSSQIEWKVLYFFEVLSSVCIAFIGIFPGGNSFRNSNFYTQNPRCGRWTDLSHGTFSFLTLVSIDIENFLYAYFIVTKHKGYGVLVLCFSIVSVLFALFTFIIGLFYDHELNRKENGENNSRLLNRFSWFFESSSFLICVLFAICSSLYRNDNITCWSH